MKFTISEGHQLNVFQCDSGSYQLNFMVQDCRALCAQTEPAKVIRPALECFVIYKAFTLLVMVPYPENLVSRIISLAVTHTYKQFVS